MKVRIGVSVRPQQKPATLSRKSTGYRDGIASEARVPDVRTRHSVSNPPHSTPPRDPTAKMGANRADEGTTREPDH